MRKSKMMKALMVFGMSVVTATAMVGITACDNNNGGNGHTHVPDGWLATGLATNDGNGSLDGEHWHVCVECEEEYDRAKHKDANSDGVCDVCEKEITHKFKTEWVNNDATGHWHAADCVHTTVKDSESPHVDEDATPNVCDVCGYVGETSQGYKDFVASHASATQVINNTFFVSGKLPLFDSWGTKGLYASEDSATNKVDLSGGKANLVTPNATPATYLYLDWGNTNGIIEGYFDMSDFANGTSGYTPVQFQAVDGGNGTEAFGLRANTNWQYRLNGGTGVNLSENISVADCNVYFSYNSATKKLTVKINDKVVVEDQQLDAALGGIKFSTGDGNNKTFSLDNIIVVSTPIDLAPYKTALQANAVAEKAKVLPGITVDTASADAVLAGVESATTNAECDTAYNAFLETLVSAYKTGVNAKIASTYPEGSYNAENNEDKTAYTTATGALATDLAAANTMDKVTAAYNKADNALKVLHDNAYWNSTPFDVTVSGSAGSATIANKRAGDKITKADLDAVAKVGDTDVITGYTIDGQAVDFGENGYVLSGAVTFVAVVDTATSDKGTYTYTLSGDKTNGFTVNKEKTDGSLGDPATILAGVPATASDSKDFKFGANTDKLTFKLNVTAGQTVTITVSGKGGSDKANGLQATTSGVAATVTAGDAKLVDQTGKVDFADKTVTYTVSAAGVLTIDLARVSNSIKVGTVIITVADPVQS